MVSVQGVRTERTGYVGKTADGDRVYVSIELTPTSGVAQSVGHRAVSDVTRVSVCGHYFQKGSRRRDWDGGGQSVDMVAGVVSDFTDGWSAKDVARLVELWERWHLNDLRAGCVHQVPVLDERGNYDLDRIDDCPVTGYRFGSAWLVEVAPPDVLAELGKFMDMLDGSDGLR